MAILKVRIKGTTDKFVDTVVDDDVFVWANKYKWTARYRPERGKGFKLYPESSRGTLHRLIMNAPKEIQVDHVNGDTLDNRRINLRFATISQQAANRTIPANTIAVKKSKYRGVSKRYRKYTVELKYKGRETVYRGFDDEITAAEFYDLIAWQFFGEFATLNFPRE